MSGHALGIDIGAETIKLVVLRGQGTGVRIVERHRVVHNKDPHSALIELAARLDLSRVTGVAVTGRLHGSMAADTVPTKAALRHGARIVHPELTALTVVSIGAHGFSVLEIHRTGQDFFQQNSRCSQGTGNFLGQLVQRFGLSIEEASELCDGEANPAPLSGRCPVILKTDMTHLANKGESHAAILAGLYDAVTENVATLVRPRLAPKDVVLVGGVAHSARIRRTLGAWLAERGLRLGPASSEDDFVEAIGAAAHALEHGGTRLPAGGLSSLLSRACRGELERVPPLRDALARVHRMAPVPPAWRPTVRPCIVGLDIGSTGSKAVALDAEDGAVLWEAYLNTEGAPVRAAQRLVERFARAAEGRGLLLGLGVTGSGREVVGSLLRTCYGSERVFILNEIAAHARGAAALDPAVDTIFEIGGQDAKYIRLEEGRVIDAAMNEACSAGTGSFIAEQGNKFDGIDGDPRRLASLALAAEHGISLGQHCSVFMAEVIDEAIAQGAPRDAIIAGLYDSVIQNYLNRVKGARSVGERIFCQGMPFSSDALAAAVARQTGRDVVVPPNPGTIGALGIALLLLDELAPRLAAEPPLAVERFLEARVVAKETMVCRSTKGCGGSGNHCRIDRLRTVVAGKQQQFLWGGNCSLYDRGAGRSKLPDLAPDPFRQREALLDQFIVSADKESVKGTVAFTDEFALKQLAPLFIVFLQSLGYRCHLQRHAGHAALRTGIEGARIPYCAPVQLIHGVHFELAAAEADYLLVPMVKELPRVAEEEHGTLCPMVLALPDLLSNLLPAGSGRLLRPLIEFGEGGYRGEPLRRSLRRLADDLDAHVGFEQAYLAAVAAQERFDEECLRIGQETLDFCRATDVVPVVVLGRPYTIYNDVLNSNVPVILRSLGAMPIPVDCLPVSDDVPVFEQQYWAHTQRNLRAAEWVRRNPGVYSVFCSNYACGPDSFTLHFFAYIMQGKPFAVVETDGHSGDAGTKTRMEAFLYCVDSDLKSGASALAARTDFKRVSEQSATWGEAKSVKARVLLPRMGPSALVAAAALRGEGYRADALPLSTRDDVRMGRRYTSGKECVPMMLTLGTLLNELERLPAEERNLRYFMPTAHGPCRFGVYHALHKLTLERLGLSERVKLLIPDDADYFAGMSPEFSAKLWVGFVAHDLLQMMLRDVRPVERRPGGADSLYTRYLDELISLMERSPRGGNISIVRELLGGMWGARRILERAAEDFAALRRRGVDVPAVSVVGEIYVRLDPFANDHLVDKLEARGLRVRFAPFIEWLEYSNHIAAARITRGEVKRTDDPLVVGITALVQRVTLDILYPLCARRLGWPNRARIEEILETSKPYIDPALTGEAALTVGGPLHEYAHGLIEGVVIVGPHECMPCKISEAQYGAAVERLGIPYLSIAVTGEPIDTEIIDRFAYDIHQNVRRRVSRAGLSMLPRLQEGAREASKDTFERELATTPLN